MVCLAVCGAVTVELKDLHQLLCLLLQLMALVEAEKLVGNMVPP